MKKVFDLIKKYFKEHFNPLYFTVVVIFTALMVAVQYHYNVERNYIDWEPDSGKRLQRYLMMYGLAFGGAYALLVFNKENKKLLWNWKLWMMILFSVVLFSVRTWFHQYTSFTEKLRSAYHMVANKYFDNLQGFIFIF